MKKKDGMKKSKMMVKTKQGGAGTMNNPMSAYKTSKKKSTGKMTGMK